MEKINCKKHTHSSKISSHDEKELARVLNSISSSDWKEYTDGSERMVYWTTGPYARLARDITAALYCMASDGTDTSLFEEGAEFLTTTINNCLKVFGSKARIEIKADIDQTAMPASTHLS